MPNMPSGQQQQSARLKVKERSVASADLLEKGHRRNLQKEVTGWNSQMGQCEERSRERKVSTCSVAVGYSIDSTNLNKISNQNVFV